MDEPIIQQAVQAIRAGKKQEAQTILSKILLEDSQNGDAWVLLSDIVDENQERIHCLQQALRINPKNRDAVQKLRRLQSLSRWAESSKLDEIHKTELKSHLSAPDSNIRQSAPAPPSRLNLRGIFPFIKYVSGRFVYMLVTLLTITLFLYGFFFLLMPPEARATAYMPPWGGKGNWENRIESIIQEYGFRDPFPVQYGRWAGNLLKGDWGMSTTINDEVIDILLLRTPATAELIFFSILMFIPLGLVSGVVSGWKQGKVTDWAFRLTAFMATSIPPFVLGLMLLAVFYIGLHWFPPGRISQSLKFVVSSPEFKNYTNLLVFDGILNGRFDIALDAIRHMVLPAFTLSLTYWATLGRITRAVMIDELQEDYITVARGKGLRKEQVLWIHAFRNTMIPGLNSIALSAAMFLTNAVIIEIVFGYPGISKPLTQSLSGWYADVNLAMGFAIYSTLFVLPLMFVLDVIQGMVDPRIRDGEM